ncbi:MAG: fibronectin type III domain-containing protein, partial [Nanoarchaeota archaeon]|nr:fibronectin type III domain-containing protein [Nanoarchaeota archaeon]
MNKTTATLAIILIELIILMPFAFVDALTINSVQAAQITNSGATITWIVDQSADATVTFGTTTLDQVQTQALNFNNNKAITLNNLLPATQYLFKVASNNLTQTVEDNNGAASFTFTTLPAPAFILNATVPTTFNQGNTMSISGTTSPLAELQLLVDNFLKEERVSGQQGEFTFSNVNLPDGNHFIKIIARKDNKQTEKIFPISVDTIPPELNLTDIPLFAPEQEYHVIGFVSEPVTLEITVEETEEDEVPPGPVTNFNITKIEANVIELSWKQSLDVDFNRYVLSRDGQPFIFFDDDKVTTFKDIGVNSARNYTYSIFAVDDKGNVGSTSASLSVTTLPAGKTDFPEAESINFLQGVGVISSSTQVNGNFNIPVQLGEEEQFYTLRVTATDSGANSISEQFEILLDTTPPTIEIISPKNGQEIFENFADAVTIRGKTEPGARVFLYVQRTPFNSFFNRSFEITGLSSRLETLGDSDLRAKCDFAVLGIDKCKTHADKETIADADGIFEFEDVDVTNIFQGAFRIKQQSTSTPQSREINSAGTKDAVNSNLLFVAQDLAGRRSAEKLTLPIKTCFSGNFSFIAKPLPQYQSPTFLSVERLRSGDENLYFYFNFSYVGRSKRAFLTSVSIDKACGDFLDNEDRYNISCKILNKCNAELNPDRTTAYVTCSLDAVDQLEFGGSEDIESFIDAFKEEMAFPLKLTLQYEEQSLDPIPAAGSAPGQQTNQVPQFATNQQTQTFCEEVSYVVDAAFIDPRDVLPDWLLYDFVDTLNTTIYHLNTWIEKLREILEWLAIGCVASFFLKFVFQIYRRITCHYDRFFKYASGALTSAGGGEDKCKECVDNEKIARDTIESDYAIANPGNLLPGRQSPNYYKSIGDTILKQDSQDSLSDACLGECYPSCASAWNSEELLYKTYRFACDRVFGHASPSKWTEKKTDGELSQKIETGSGCANDQSVKGMPIRVQSCRELESKYPLLAGTFTRDDQCVEIRQPSSGSLASDATIYKIEQPIDASRGIYRISAVSTVSSVKEDIIIKQNEKNYLYRRPQKCEEICSGTQTNAPITLYKRGALPKIEKPAGVMATEKINGACMLANDCLQLQKESKGAKKNEPVVRVTADGKYLVVEEATLEGYAADCWSEDTISGDPAVRAECCCVSKAKADRPNYYVPADVESKDGEGKATTYGDMDWSYRYFKVGWRAPSGATSFNPNRYIKGRDVSACFGQNHILYDGISGKNEKLLTINPIKQHVAAFQCLAVSQIVNRLTLLKNILVSLQTCMLQIRTTGTADGGVCKELFSQFICSFLWKVIQWVTNGCLPFGSGIDFSKSDSRIAEAVGVGIKGVFDSVGDTQTELANEYGNAKLNNLLGVGQEAVFRKVCLAAFGYDWEIDLDDLIDIAYDAPFATLVQAVLPGQEFITFNPKTAQATYEYRSSWLINPGCDLEGYEVYLTCVTPEDRDEFSNLPGTPGGINCGKQGRQDGSNCDCMNVNLDNSKNAQGNAFSRPRDELFFQHRTKIGQNELVEVDSSIINDRIKTSPYRYDHLKFVLDVDREYKRNNGNVENCFPEGHESGVFYFPIVDYSARDIIGCTANIDGTFSCNDGANFFSERGDAHFKKITLTNQAAASTVYEIPSVIPAATYYAGNNEQIAGEVVYENSGGKNQCLNIRVLDENGNILKTDIAPKTIEETDGINTLRFNTNFRVSDQDLNKKRGSITFRKKDAPSTATLD